MWSNCFFLIICSCLTYIICCFCLKERFSSIFIFDIVCFIVFRYFWFYYIFLFLLNLNYIICSSFYDFLILYLVIGKYKAWDEILIFLYYFLLMKNINISCLVFLTLYFDNYKTLILWTFLQFVSRETFFCKNFF